MDIFKILFMKMEHFNGICDMINNVVEYHIFDWWHYIMLVGLWKMIHLQQDKNLHRHPNKQIYLLYFESIKQVIWNASEQLIYHESKERGRRGIEPTWQIVLDVSPPTTIHPLSRVLPFGFLPWLFACFHGSKQHL